MERELFDVEYDEKSILLEERKNKIFKRSEKMKYDEEFHTKGRAGWIVDLYFELDHFILDLKPGIRKEFLESYVKYSFDGLLFAYIVLRKGETLRLWAKIPYTSLGVVPLFVRDYEPVSRRVGVLITVDDQREFVANKEAVLRVILDIVKKALQKVAGRKERKKTPLLKRIEEVEQVEKKIKIIEPSSINIIAGENGYLEINFKIHKSKKLLLDKILQETILK